MTVLKAERLIKIYGQMKGETTERALNEVDLKIQDGEFVGIMGPSGSGKSTLLNILSGIDSPTSGNVVIMDKKISDLNSDKLALFRRKNIGFIFQDFNLLDSLTVKENIMLPLILDKQKPKITEEKTEEIMKFLGIYDIKDKYPYNISGGQKQRVAASRALIIDPAIVFADEPTGNLDSKSSNDIMNYLQRINEEKKSTILMVTHDPFAASFCKRIIFIKDGEINMEVTRKGKRKEFFDEILNCLAIIGGEQRDI